MTSNRMAAMAAGAVLLVAGIVSAQNTDQQYGYPPTASQSSQRGQMQVQMKTATGSVPKTEGSQGQGVPSTGIPVTPGTLKARVQEAREGGMPGIPNTGSGGDTTGNAMLLGLAAIATLAGAGYLLRKRSS